MIHLDTVSRVVRSGDAWLTILDRVSLEIPEGQFVAVTGPSGSGKSTLLGLIAGLDRPTSGDVRVAGCRFADLTEDELSMFRGRTIGVVFQAFHLIPTLTALENVQVPLELAGMPDVETRAHELLSAVGLSSRQQHLPTQLSGGEQQRVAIARAFAARSRVLLADEPTGSLDSHAGDTVMQLLADLNLRHGTTLVLVTHNPDLCRLAQRVVTLADGRIASDVQIRGEPQSSGPAAP